MKTETVVSYWSAKNFDDRMNVMLEELEKKGYEILKIQFRHNWCFYVASILYK